MPHHHRSPPNSSLGPGALGSRFQTSADDWLITVVGAPLLPLKTVRHNRSRDSGLPRPWIPRQEFTTTNSNRHARRRTTGSSVDSRTASTAVGGSLTDTGHRRDAIAVTHASWSG